MKIVLYGLLGGVLGFSGINAIENTPQFIVIMLLVLAIDMHTFFNSRG